MHPSNVYVQLSDKTLWLLESRRHVLPVYVMKVALEDDQDDLSWFLWPAMDFREHAFKWFERAVKSICDSKNGKYWICKDPNKIPELMSKAEGVTPEFYYKDRDVNQEEAVKRVKDATSEDLKLVGGISENFIDEVVEKASIANTPTMKIILDAVVQTVMEWLVVKHRPVNLGFAVLQPLPYRANWKPALLRFFPQSGNVFSRSEYETEGFADSIGLMAAFLSRELLSIKKEFNTCEWTIEIVPTKLWWDATNQAEETRISQLGPRKYSDYIANEISKARKSILAVYRDYILRSMRPFAVFSQMAEKDTRVLLPSSRTGKADQRRLESAHADLVLDSPVDWEKPSLKSLVEQQVREVSQVSDVRQQSAELRLSGEDDG